MTNKWQIEIDVDGEDVDIFTELLDAEIRRCDEDLTMAADEQEHNGISTHIASLRDLKAQVELSWIERVVETFPPPSEYSAHVPVAIDHSPPVYQGGCSEEIVANGYVVAP